MTDLDDLRGIRYRTARQAKAAAQDMAKALERDLDAYVEAHLTAMAKHLSDLIGVDCKYRNAKEERE